MVELPGRNARKERASAAPKPNTEPAMPFPEARDEKIPASVTAAESAIRDAFKVIFIRIR